MKGNTKKNLVKKEKHSKEGQLEQLQGELQIIHQKRTTHLKGN